MKYKPFHPSTQMLPLKTTKKDRLGKIIRTEEKDGEIIVYIKPNKNGKKFLK